MNKTIWFLLFLVLVAIGIGVYFISAHSGPTLSQITPPQPTAFDPANATYTINGAPVMLVNGKSSQPAAPDSATQVTTTLFGIPTSGDINNDGQADAAGIIVQNPGGSGTFYYIAAAINSGHGAIGTNAILLGDRIAPQNVEIQNDVIVVNYADRKESQSMSTLPSVGVTKYFIYKNGSLIAAPSAPTGVTVSTTVTTGGGGTGNTGGGTAGANCGGNMLNPPACAIGYHCAPRPGSHLPFGDVGGVCVAN